MALTPALMQLGWLLATSVLGLSCSCSSRNAAQSLVMELGLLQLLSGATLTCSGQCLAVSFLPLILICSQTAVKPKRDISLKIRLASWHVQSYWKNASHDSHFPMIPRYLQSSSSPVQVKWFHIVFVLQLFFFHPKTQMAFLRTWKCYSLIDWIELCISWSDGD